MSWSAITTYGNGRMRFALVIEGWPEIWVTDHSLTLSNSRDGRTVRVGLLRQGLQFSERALLLQGKLEASAMTFRFVSGDHAKHTVASFASVPEEISQIASNLTTGADKITLISDAVVESGYYHIGTEVIYITEPETPNDEKDITRGHWDTQAQSFYIADGETQITHQLYSRPRTMEGRRATLYVWGDGDDATRYDPDGDEATWGRPIWRGFVSLPPRFERDGVTWTITADHVSKAFDQQLCARNTEIRPTGIQFNVGCPLYIGAIPPGSVVLGGKHLFFARGVTEFISIVNAALEALRVDPLYNLDAIFSSITISQDRSTRNFYLLGITVAVPGDLYDSAFISIRSHYTGYVVAGLPNNEWVNLQNNSVADGTFAGDAQYRCDFNRPPEWATEAPDDTTQTLFGEKTRGTDGSYVYKVGGTTLATLTEIREEWVTRRLFIDRAWTSLSARGLHISRKDIEGTRAADADMAQYQTESITLTVIDSGIDADSDAYWILVDNRGAAAHFHGWVHSDTIIRPTYSPEGATDVVGFISALIEDVAENANDGNLPFIRDVDFDTDTEVVSSLPGITGQRSYRFVKPVAVSDIIAEELKLVGYMWSTDKNSAKLTFTPIPIVTGSIALTRDDNGNGIEIGRSETQTPAGGSGSFPGFEIQSQGIVSVVIVKDGYDAAEDSHVGYVHTVADQNLLSTHKRRALTELTIAPKSVSDTEILAEDAQKIAARLMAVLGREYVTVKVQVPFSRFRVMLGDVVSLTSPHVPNASGTLGVTSKRCIVIGRRWNLDPARNEHGELELLMLLDEPAGYTPSGVITGQSGSTTTWTLTLSEAVSANILISPRGDGDVAGTFGVGDEIRIVEQDSTTPTVRTGVVSAQSGNTVSVTLNASWTPGASAWHLEYATAASATASQRLGAFVADENLLINDDGQARRFV